jgi:hypothetical protein
MMRRAIRFLCRFVCLQPQREFARWPTVVYTPPPVDQQARRRMAAIVDAHEVRLMEFEKALEIEKGMES